MTFKIVRIDKRGTPKHGYVFYPIINVGATRYEIDIENAINVGEVNLPGMARNQKNINTADSGLSIADELIKFKKLKDDGVITEDEFQKQKEKLLNR